MNNRITKILKTTASLLSCSVIVLTTTITAKAEWVDRSLNVGSTGCIIGVGFENRSDGDNYGYAKVSASDYVDVYLSGSITYETSDASHEKYFTHEAYEKTYTEVICTSHDKKINYIECRFTICSSDGSESRFLPYD